MERKRVRLVTYAWGKRYVDKLLSYTMASVLAPGNLPALAESFACEVLIITEEKLFDYVRAHPVTKRVERVCPYRLVSLDDLIGEPWQYGMTLAYALFRGMSDLGPRMTETFFLFLNSDFVVANGSYSKLARHILNGDRVLLAPSYCTNEEDAVPLLDAARDAESVLSLAPRQLAKIILRHRHNTIRAKTINQNLVHFKYMDQFYWDVDADTLLGAQMPISLVGMQPEVALVDITSFWDWGIVYDFCPSRRLTALGDSDDFLMLELRAAREHWDLMILGWNSPVEIASRMRGYMTCYQVDNARLPLTLHAADLPRKIHDARTSLEQFRDELIRNLPTSPIDHVGHKDWEYHKKRFAEIGKDRPRLTEIARLKSEIARVEEKYKTELEELQQELALLLPDQAPPPPAAPMAVAVYSRVMGYRPHYRPWHPRYLPSKPMSEAFKRAAAEKSTLLYVSEVGAGGEFPAGQYVHSTPANLVKGRFSTDRANIGFDSAVIDMPSHALALLPEVLGAVVARTNPGGSILVHVDNSALQALDSWSGALIGPIIGRFSKIELLYSSSGLSAASLLAMRWANRQRQRRSALARVQTLMAVGASTCLAIAAFCVESLTRRKAAAKAIPQDCTSVSVQISVGEVGGRVSQPNHEEAGQRVLV